MLVAAGLIGGRSNYARGLARRLAGPEASAKTGALRRGVERREDAPRAFPSRDRGPAAPRAGAPRRAVPRDPVLASFAITTCARRVEEILPSAAVWARPVFGRPNYHDESSYLSERQLLRVPITGIYHTAWYEAAARATRCTDQVRLDCSHCQSSATRHPLRA